MNNDLFFEEAQTSHTDYENERNKPMPNRIHGAIQNQIGFLLKQAYGKTYQFISELSLDTTPGTTPDLCVYPKKKLSLKEIKAKEEEAPMITIEIQFPSQSIESLQAKAWNQYFPMGVQSAWIVIPALKAVKIILPDDREFFFNSGVLKDPIFDIELNVKAIFEDLE